jgi:hypothetical protein
MSRSSAGRFVALAASALLALAALVFPSPSSTAAPATPAAQAHPAKATKKWNAGLARTFAKEKGGKGTCDPMAAGACELPFPNDWYTQRDAKTATGRSLDLSTKTLPKTKAGFQFPAEALNRNDGFSPGSILTTLAPHVDTTKSHLAPITDIGSSLAKKAPAVIVDLATGEIRPYWAELDSRTTNPKLQSLLIHPAANLLTGHSYAVGLRGLVDSKGKALKPSGAFKKLRGKTLPAKSPLRNRQKQLAPVFKALAAVGFTRSSLYQAWGFTVASEENLASDVLTMRDQSYVPFEGSPTITVTNVEDNDQSTEPAVARWVTGTIEVPNYLSSDDAQPGGHLVRGADGLPQKPAADHTTNANFTCTIPWAAMTTPGTPSLYGHGLLGSADEVRSGSHGAVKNMAQTQDFVFCATDWIGIADPDTSYDASAIINPNNFPNVIDRMKQALLNAMFLGRAMTSPDGMSSLPAFQNASGQSVIDTSQKLAYDGNSQGGIMGGALVATDPDIDYGVLGVTGMNYSVLLDRSADFGLFGTALTSTYKNRLDVQITLELMQILWDRGETDGYAALLASSPTKRVLMHIAFGDHQVADIAAETEARTIGARISPDPISPGRNPDVVPYWGIETIPSYPYAGSAIVIWDSGSPAPPLTNNPPTEGHDPHSDPRNSPDGWVQKGEFLRTGTVIDVCDGGPCMTDPV